MRTSAPSARLFPAFVAPPSALLKEAEGRVVSVFWSRGPLSPDVLLILSFLQIDLCLGSFPALL
jgi:hypothetical protein